MVRSAPRPVPHRRLSRTRQAAKRRANRRQANWPRRILSGTLLVLAVECVAVALLSPRFFVKRVTIQGQKTLPASLIRNQFTVALTQNLFLAPTREWQRRIGCIPGIASVSIQRTLPGTIHLVVQERAPWATVRTSDGRWHTVDTNFIPFRVGKQPEPNLPRIQVSDLAPWEAIPGMRLPSPGLVAAQICNRWAQVHPDFSITQIEIDQESNVCLNRVGGVPVRLGRAEGISQKLVMLEKLLSERPDLFYSTSIAYVNLYAADAPAIGPVLPEKQKP